MTDTYKLPKNCHIDPKYPNDAICTGVTDADVKCDVNSKHKNESIINMYYIKKQNNMWSCNTKAGNCNIDQCKNIVYYNGDPCVILSNSNTDTFVDSQMSESVICMNMNTNNIVKYDYIDSNWIIRTDPTIPLPKKITTVTQNKQIKQDPNITNYVDDSQSANMS
jgi:hypothetical protein